MAESGYNSNAMRRYLLSKIRDSSPGLSTVAYATCSMSMTLTNKFLVDTFHFNYPFFLVAVQNSITLLLLLVSRSLFPEVIDLGMASSSLAKAKRFAVGSLMFVMTLTSGMHALRLLSVPVVTVLKNFGIILVALGDHILFGQFVDMHTIFALLLILLSSVLSGLTDLSFTLNGYLWMLFNITANMGYVLYTRFALKTFFKTEFELCFYNCILSLPMLLAWSVASSEFANIVHYDGLSAAFLCTLVFSSVVGFALSLASLWCINANSAVHFSMVGAIAKIPLSVIGYVVFPRPMSFNNGCSVAFGLLSGVFYSHTKYRRQRMQPAEASKPVDDDDDHVG